MPEISAYGLTHIGNVREDNQDAFRLGAPDDAREHGHLFAIADGMGGYAYGSVASNLALDIFFQTVYGSNGMPPRQKLSRGIQSANVGVYQKAQSLRVGRMGTTLTAVSLLGNSLHIAHVGDSRAYLVREQSVRCLTNDHTRVGELVRMKVLSPDKLRTHAARSVLMKCLGVELFVKPDLHTAKVQEGDRIVLCTDGVWSMVQDQEFASPGGGGESPEMYCTRILNLALERESDDNLSIVMIEILNLASAGMRERTGLSGLRRFFRWSP